MRLQIPSIPSSIGITVWFVGGLIALGWLLDWESVIVLTPNMASMKFVSAVGFVFAGMTLYGMQESVRNRKANQFKLFCLSYGAFSLLTHVLFLSFIELFGDKRAGIVVLVKDKNLFETIAPGVPSIATLFAFALIGTAGVVAIYNTRRVIKRIRLIASVLSLISLSAFTGYALKIPTLYFYFPQRSTAMSLQSAILIALVSIGLFVAVTNYKDSKQR